MNLSGVADFNIEISCAIGAWKNIDTDITNFVQSSYHYHNYSNNYNEASGTYYYSNSDGELLEPYISYDNGKQTNKGGKHTTALCSH